MSGPLCIANWKSNKTVAEATAWCEGVHGAPAGVTMVVAFPFPLLAVSKRLPPGWLAGAQDVSPYPFGQYTGAVVAAQLKDASVSYCLIGHSERRRYFHETTEDIVLKCEQLLSNGIRPVVCVDKPYMKELLGALLRASIQSKSIDIAYEPVAAIGTGQPEALGIVEATIKEIKRQWPESKVIYGGSITGENTGTYLLVSDGLLIGGASLATTSMNEIMAAAAASAHT